MGLRRTANLAKLAGGALALRLRGKGAGRAAALDRVVAHLGRMHGLPQKIGQILASAELDSDSRRFAPLTGSAGFALPGDDARRTVEQRLGRRIAEVFAEFDPQGIAASLGQVHRARLRDGRRVAVKFSYPEVSETLRTDLRALGWLAAPLGNLRRDFDLNAYRREIGERLAGELDYRAEAAALRRFRAHTAGWTGVVVPQPVDELCGPELLVMSWLDGGDLAAAARWPLADRTALAASALRFFLAGLFNWGELHADPHPGNFRYFPSTPTAPAALGWLDFGSIHRVPPEFAAALREVIALVRARPLAEADAWSFHERAGFNVAALTPLRAVLPVLLTTLLRPFERRGTFDAARWHPGDDMPALLGDHRVAYRVAGPPSLLFFIRAFHGLLAQLRTLAVPLDWNVALEAVAGDRAQGSAPSPSAVPPGQAATTSLFVQVLEGGTQRVQLQFNGAAAAHLVDLVPEDIQPTLPAQGIDLRALARRAESSGFAPQELFVSHSGSRRIRVWLA